MPVSVQGKEDKRDGKEFIELKDGTVNHSSLP